MKLLITSALTAVALAGCSKSNNNVDPVDASVVPPAVAPPAVVVPPVVANQTFPNGVWNTQDVVYFFQTDTAEAIDGSALVTPERLVEYYRTADDCSVKYNNAWSADQQYTAFDTSIETVDLTSEIVPAEGTDVAVTDLVVYFRNADGNTLRSILFNTDGPYSATSEADLDVAYAPLCEGSTPAEPPVVVEPPAVVGNFPNGIWRKVTQDRWHEDGLFNYLGREAFGGSIVTDGRLIDFGSHLYDDNMSNSGVGERCYHTGQGTYSSWPNTLNEFPGFLMEWSGDYQDAFVTGYENGRKDEINYMTYIGPVTDDAVAAITAEFLPLCTHGQH